MKLALVLCLTTLPSMTWASSEEAWEDFRLEVEHSCRSLVQPSATATVAMEINPFGSESYGAALVTVTDDSGQDRMICIFEKRSRKAEITAPFGDAAPAE